MAKVVTRSPYGLVRGRDAKIGGNVLYPIKNRQFARSYAPATVTYGPKAVLVRTIFSIITAAWQMLTPDEAQSWSLAAKQIIYRDKFSQPYKLTPSQLFTQANMAVLFSGGSVNTTAPAVRPRANIIPFYTLKHSTMSSAVRLFFNAPVDTLILKLTTSAILPSANYSAAGLKYVTPTVFTQDSYAVVTNSDIFMEIADTELMFPILDTNIIGIEVSPFTAGGFPGPTSRQVLTVGSF